MREVSRRLFLKGSSAAALAAGAITTIPGLPAVLGAAETEAPADTGTAESAVTEAEGAGSLSQPLVAHVRDLSTGEIGLYSGTREVTLVDPQLAARLARAVR
jgi:hypothetical protein